ncbi:MAG TPA: hypothetical protein EYN66_18760 [Myxococcales bacterium]|nr:hypothetical protein [Myxococcales bacterium]
MNAPRVSLSVFHFNLQYVAGGLDNFFGQTVSEIAIEDAIIVESFEPLVDLFERHPNWGGSFEMQGLMLEVMAQRHPEIAKRFHKLVRRGQVDLMSFHWSDQLVTAYTWFDQEWSWLENQRIFDALCMPRSRAHFLQEGQFGPGLSAFVADKENGVMVLPRNLLSYHHEPHPVGLYFKNDGHPVIVTNGHAQNVLEVGWNFADDGELLATGNLNPYAFDVFKHNPEFLKKEYEDKLTALEADGWVIAPISHYLALLEDRGVEPIAIDPPVLDGSWQPENSGNMFIWMGGEGLVPGDERDLAILTGNVTVRSRLLAVETLITLAEKQNVDTALAKEWQRMAVRELLLAECSDTTGWRPQKNRSRLRSQTPGKGPGNGKQSGRLAPQIHGTNGDGGHQFKRRHFDRKRNFWRSAVQRNTHSGARRTRRSSG